ncbi:MAG: 23S rRNA (adenine(2503)-C(2))-methyltransferase RlmN, partial [Polyangiales bacterium]
TNLPKALRARLAGELEAPVTIAQDLRSTDDTRKLLVRLGDGREVETVLIPELAGDGTDGGDPDPDADADGAGAAPQGRAVTQCVSSQVGCAMACAFCASGLAGLRRNLGAAEIVAQVLAGRAALDEGQRLRNVVFMGMGEPLHNYGAVERALELLIHPRGIALSPRRITVSTSGLVPQIDRLAERFEGQVGLAISLHAADDETRSRIMPINKKHALGGLVACLRRYPLPKGRRITVEWTLIDGVNDTPEHADRLVDLLDGIPFKANLIPMNPVPETPLGAPSERAVEAFRKRLRHHGVPTFVRKQRGDDIDAACGQLALHGDSRRAKRPRLVTSAS